MADIVESISDQPLVIKNTFYELKEEGDEIDSQSGAKKFNTAPPGGVPVSAAPMTSMLSCTAEEPEQAAEEDDSWKSTVMLRNVPTTLGRDEFLALIDSQGFFGKYDFFYLPIDFASKSNFGYCFINLVTPEVAQQFWQHFDGFTQWPYPNDTVAVVSWSAKHQGLEQNVERYRNCPVMFDKLSDECRPVLLTHGVRVPFPPPTKRLRQPRVRAKKSNANEDNPTSNADDDGDGASTASPMSPSRRADFGLEVQ